MKYIVTTIAALFATAAMAQTPAPKADAKPATPAAATPAPKADAKPATPAASAPAKKDEKKAAEPAKK